MLNSKLTCVIIDDEPLAVSLLESFVEKTPGLELLASFTNSVEAISAVRKLKPQLLFLDIQMPNVNGMELAASVGDTTRVVFTTAFREYAFDSYEVNALDFLLKPIRYTKFLAAVEKARQWFDRPATPPLTTEQPGATPPTALFIRVDGELRPVPFDRIVYVSGMKDYVMFYLDDEPRPLVTHLTMKAVEAMLPRDRFLRIHRSYIIATGKIRKIDRNNCVYIGQEIIHVPETYQDAFRAFVAQHTF